MRWGAGKWGAFQWGAEGVARRLTWGFCVDWNDDGTFSGENEMENMLEMNIRRGREFFMQAAGDGFQRRAAGNIRVTLKNINGRYDPFNTSGPLYGLLERNQRVKITVRDEETGTIYAVFFGRIDDIRPNYGGMPTVTLTASDGIKLLEKAIVRTAGVAVAEQYDAAAAEILTAAGWADGTDIDTTASDAMPYWWANGTSAYNQLCNLVDAVVGNFFISADGKATYRPRVLSDAPVLTYTDGDALYEWKIRSPSPRETIKNKIQVYARARKAHSGVDLWTLVDVPDIPAGESRTIWAEFSYNGESIPATSLIAPVAYTDYTANTNSGGSGTDLTGLVSLAVTNFATSAKIVVTNGSSYTGYMTLLKLRGTGIAPDNYTFSETSDDLSIGKYGERLFTVNTDWLQSANMAIDQAATLLILLANPRYYPQFMVRGRPGKQFAIELNDLATISFTSINLGANMRLGYIEHNVTAATGGNIVDTVLYFEPNLAGSIGTPWVFPMTFPATF